MRPTDAHSPLSTRGRRGGGGADRRNAFGLLALPGRRSHPGGGGTERHQRSVLGGIARDTWRFYGADVDPNTHLPLDNLGPGATRGTYTSAANIGVYLWAVVAARDLGLIAPPGAGRLADDRTLEEVADVTALRRFSLPVV